MNNLIKNFLINWNNFPIDYWWRHKYNIPFGSSRHREMCWIDMAIEYLEEKEITRAMTRDEEEDEYENTKLNDGREIVKLNSKEIDEEYEKLDLSEFDKKD